MDVNTPLAQFLGAIDTSHHLNPNPPMERGLEVC